MNDRGDFSATLAADDEDLNGSTADFDLALLKSLPFIFGSAEELPSLLISDEQQFNVDANGYAGFSPLGLDVRPSDVLSPENSYHLFYDPQMQQTGRLVTTGQQTAKAAIRVKTEETEIEMKEESRPPSPLQITQQNADHGALDKNKDTSNHRSGRKKIKTESSSHQEGPFWRTDKRLRNRQAAHRYRIKKKELSNQLQTELSEALALHASQANKIAQLQAENTALKARVESFEQQPQAQPGGMPSSARSYLSYSFMPPLQSQSGLFFEQKAHEQSNGHTHSTNGYRTLPNRRGSDI